MHNKLPLILSISFVVSVSLLLDPVFIGEIPNIRKVSYCFCEF